jgi:glycosyltransferase involved in cell wall biosynthesis
MSPWPKISIVTPSYNQAAFVEATLRSVLDQGYPNLEYLVMEDGSTDGSPAIIGQYRDRLAQYVAEPNRGFGAVLNDGLHRTTGEIMAWLNSDDLYLPYTLSTVARIFRDCPEVDWITGLSLLCDQAGNFVRIVSPEGFSRRLFFSGRYLGGHPAWSGRWIPQESVFWRRSLWEKSGAHFLTERLQYGDFELWSRFWKHADLHVVPLPLGVYREHAATYTSTRGTKSIEPCTRLLAAAGEETLSLSAIRRRELLSRLGTRALQKFGQPAKAVKCEPATGRWRSETVYVA